MEMAYNLKSLGETFQVISVISKRLQKMDINDCGLFSLCELRGEKLLKLQNQMSS